MNFARLFEVVNQISLQTIQKTAAKIRHLVNLVQLVNSSLANGRCVDDLLDLLGVAGHRSHLVLSNR